MVDTQGLDLPGGKVKFTPELRFIPGSSEKRVSCYQVLDQDGHTILPNSVDQHVRKNQDKEYIEIIQMNNVGYIVILLPCN